MSEQPFRDGWGPGASDNEEWPAGDREGWGGCDVRTMSRGWPLIGSIALWIAAFIGVSFVGFVFGVMIVRSFL